jgi:hypothetical protein
MARSSSLNLLSPLGWVGFFSGVGMAVCEGFPKIRR